MEISEHQEGGTSKAKRPLPCPPNHESGLSWVSLVSQSLSLSFSQTLSLSVSSASPLVALQTLKPPETIKDPDYHLWGLQIPIQVPYLAAEIEQPQNVKTCDRGKFGNAMCLILQYCIALNRFVAK